MRHISYVAARPFRTVGLALVLLGAFAVGVMFVIGAQATAPRHQPVGSAASPVADASGSPASSPSATAVPAVTGSVPTPAPVPVSTLGAFICSATTLNPGTSPTVAYVNAVRTGAHTGYDRFVIQFNNGQPTSIDLRPQTGTTFMRSPRGDTVTLAGMVGLQVVIRGADGHTSYNGPTDIKTGDARLIEVRQLEDFEGQVQWGLGLAGTPCYRGFMLSNPTRLVIDVAGDQRQVS
jgi:hypothetical protein